MAIPVIYNACMDFGAFGFCTHKSIRKLLTIATEPAQTQAAENRITYILMKLIKDKALDGNEALLDFSYELIEIIAGQGMMLLLPPRALFFILSSDEACA